MVNRVLSEKVDAQAFLTMHHSASWHEDKNGNKKWPSNNDIATVIFVLSIHEAVSHSADRSFAACPVDTFRGFRESWLHFQECGRAKSLG